MGVLWGPVPVSEAYGQSRVHAVEFMLRLLPWGPRRGAGSRVRRRALSVSLVVSYLNGLVRVRRTEQANGSTKLTPHDTSHNATQRSHAHGVPGTQNAHATRTRGAGERSAHRVQTHRLAHTQTRGNPRHKEEDTHKIECPRTSHLGGNLGPVPVPDRHKFASPASVPSVRTNMSTCPERRTPRLSLVLLRHRLPLFDLRLPDPAITEVRSACTIERVPGRAPPPALPSAGSKRARARHRPPAHIRVTPPSSCARRGRG